MNLLGKIFGASTQVLMLIAQLTPLQALFAAHKGTALTDADKQTIVNAALASLETVEGISGKQIAADTDVQAAANAVINAVLAFHDIATKKHLQTPVAA